MCTVGPINMVPRSNTFGISNLESRRPPCRGWGCYNTALNFRANYKPATHAPMPEAPIRCFAGETVAFEVVIIEIPDSRFHTQYSETGFSLR